MTGERVARALWWLVGLGLAVHVGLTVWLAWTSIFFPFQLDYGEGIVLWFTRQLALGRPIYRPMDGVTFVSSNYPPVGMLLAAPFHSHFGDTYIVGRFLGFASASLTTAILMRFVRRDSAVNGWLTPNLKWAAALLAGALFLGSTFVYHWTPLFRVDLPGLAFTALGILFVREWENAHDRRKDAPLRWLLLALAGAAFLAALYTKHSLLFGPAAAVLAVFLRDRRAALVFGGALAAAGGGLFLLLDVLTRGGWSFGLITSNATVWDPTTFAGLALGFALTYAVVLVLGAWAWVARVRAGTCGVLEVYAAAALLSIALAGREGAWENYFLEAVFAACAFAGFAIARLYDSTLTWRWALPALLLVQAALFVNRHDPQTALNLMNAARIGGQEVGPLVRAANGPVISEDMGLLVTNGKPVVYYTFPYSTLARAGRWDQRWELENLRAGAFPLVVLMQGTRENVVQFGNFTGPFVSALDYNYGLVKGNARYEVYAPAPLQHLGPPAVFGHAIELVGWSLEPAEPRAGQPQVLTVVWRAVKPVAARLVSFAHLQEENAVIAQDDHEPLLGAYPTFRWPPGENVRETYTLRAPPGLTRGRYFLRVGWYDAATGDRLELPGGADYIELTAFSLP
jgi:hypothetical protein